MRALQLKNWLPRHHLIFFTLCILVSCRGSDHETLRTSLLSERTVPLKKERRAPADAIATCGFHRRPCLIQSGNASSAFMIRLEQKPVLSYTLATDGIKPKTFRAGIVVESDFPSPLRQKVTAIAGSFQEIDLAKFENRVVKIHFLSKQPRKSGSSQWIDPTIQHMVHFRSRTNSQMLEQLRERHNNSNVFLIVLDAAGSSHFGCYGYPKNTTPVIDSLAKEGVLWEDAVSQASATVASTGSLLTGLYPAEHKTTLSDKVLKERFKTIAEFFKNNGYRTALFTGNPYASPLTGYGQGFDESWHPRRGRPVNAEEFFPAVKDWIDANADRKLFAYLHFREPHSPFKPPHDMWKRFDPQTDFNLPPYFVQAIPSPETLQKVVAAYDANLASADRQLGRIFSHLKQAGIWRKSIVIILADHGEAFWEHGKQGHNYPLYEEIIRIPMIIRFPGEPGIAGKRISVPSGSIDILPTLIDLLQFSRRGGHWNGRSLLPTLEEGGITDDRFLISQTVRRKIYACRWRNFKYVWHKEDGVPDNELFDLKADPHETRNLSATYPILTSYIHLQLSKQLQSMNAHQKEEKANAEKRTTIDKDLEEELRALGYTDR